MCLRDHLNPMGGRLLRSARNDMAKCGLEIVSKGTLKDSYRIARIIRLEGAEIVVLSHHPGIVHRPVVANPGRRMLSSPVTAVSSHFAVCAKEKVALLFCPALRRIRTLLCATAVVAASICYFGVDFARVQPNVSGQQVTVCCRMCLPRIRLVRVALAAHRAVGSRVGPSS